MPAKKDPSQKYVRMDITVSPELRDRIKAYCQQNGCSASWIAQQSIEAFLSARQDKSNGEKQ